MLQAFWTPHLKKYKPLEIQTSSPVRRIANSPHKQTHSMWNVGGCSVCVLRCSFLQSSFLPGIHCIFSLALKLARAYNDTELSLPSASITQVELSLDSFPDNAFSPWASWSGVRTQYSSFNLSVNSGEQSEQPAWNRGTQHAKYLHRSVTGIISSQSYNKALEKQKQQTKSHLSLFLFRVTCLSFGFPRTV